VAVAQIAPLTPLRYDIARLAGGLSRVVAPPYDVISPTERDALAAGDPHNIVRLILPEGTGDEKYAKAAAIMSEWQREGVLVRDSQPAFYRYDQTFTPPGGDGPRLTRRGFLALVRLSPFSERVVLPHERTLSGPKEDRLKLFRATRTNLSPGFMLYSDPNGELDAPLELGRVIADFSTADGIEHVLAKVQEPDAVRAIADGISRSTLLIADGHHRYETALRYSQEVASGQGRSGAVAAHAEHLYFMAFLANGDDPNLVVFPTHRHVHSLRAFSFDDLLSRASEYFRIEELARAMDARSLLDAVQRAGHVGPTVAAAVPDGRAALLTLRADVNVAGHPTLGAKSAALRSTDVAILHSGLLEHVLGITPEAQAAKTNLWYPQDARAALDDLRAGKGQVLFLMNATPVAQVRHVAESGDVMPQKSTFFYPKILTGLAVHTLDPTRSVAFSG
jgi:uncharacterized protein (DUF1015 family)